MKKKIISFLLGITLTPMIAFAEPPTPSEYRKSEFKLFPRFVKIEDLIFYEHSYDLDGDGWADISELYPIDNLGHPKTKYPLFYGFDENKNHLYEVNEIWFDKKTNDWNGDEIRLIDLGTKIEI